MGDDEGEYVESFVQGDDAALMAAVQQRNRRSRLLKPVRAIRCKRCSSRSPLYQTRTDSVKVRAPPPAPSIAVHLNQRLHHCIYFLLRRLFTLTFHARVSLFKCAERVV